jgi:hypothetical protein
VAESAGRRRSLQRELRSTMTSCCASGGGRLHGRPRGLVHQSSTGSDPGFDTALHLTRVTTTSRAASGDIHRVVDPRALPMLWRVLGRFWSLVVRLSLMATSTEPVPTALKAHWALRTGSARRV